MTKLYRGSTLWDGSMSLFTGATGAHRVLSLQFFCLSLQSSLHGSRAHDRLARTPSDPDFPRRFAQDVWLDFF